MFKIAIQISHAKSWNLAVMLDLFVPLAAGKQLLRLQAITPKEENLHKFSVCTQLHLAISASHLSKSISYDQWPTEAAIYFALSARPLVNFTQIDATMRAMDWLASTSARVTAPFDQDPFD